MQVDLDYERRLIDRIAIREAAAALTPRMRRVLDGYYRRGDTYEEIGQRENVTGGRIGQILQKSERHLRERVAGRLVGRYPGRRIEIQPERKLNLPPFEFDRAAFLRHMRELKDWQARKEQEQFEAERAELAAMLERERSRRAFYTSPFKPIQMPVSYSVNYPPSPALLGQDELRFIAETALRMFLALRRPIYAGLPWLGKLATRVAMPFPDGEVAIAVQKLHEAMPADAQLSACPFEVPSADAIPPGTVSANAANPHASLRVSQTTGGGMLFLDVTWDEYASS